MTIKQEGDKYLQMPFSVKLELFNGESHFSEEEAHLLQSLTYFGSTVVVAFLINSFAMHKDV